MPLNKKALAGMAAEQKAYWSWAYAAARKRSLSLLAAAKSEPGDPYYAVDGQGQLFALLADGSGGAEAVEQIRKTLKEIEEVMDAIALLGTAANLSPALGVVMIHGRLLVRLYTAVAIAITMMDNSGVDEAVRQTLASAACDVLKLAGTALFGRTISMAFAGLDYIIGAFAAKLGQRNPFSCW